MGLLAVVVWTGVKARIRPHLTAVACAMVSLGFAIWFAERLGTHYDLVAAGAIYGVHLALAKTTTVSYALPIVTGYLTLRNRRRKKVHLVFALTTLALTLATAVTGTWMILVAPSRD